MPAVSVGQVWETGNREHGMDIRGVEVRKISGRFAHVVNIVTGRRSRIELVAFTGGNRWRLLEDKKDA